MSYKQAEKITGFLVYYLQFAGYTHFYASYLLKHYDVINEPEHEWWLNAVRLLIAVDHIQFKEIKVEDSHVILHADASKTQAAFCTTKGFCLEWFKASIECP